MGYSNVSQIQDRLSTGLLNCESWGISLLHPSLRRESVCILVRRLAECISGAKFGLFSVDGKTESKQRQEDKLIKLSHNYQPSEADRFPIKT
jgi:hypothetical protein